MAEKPKAAEPETPAPPEGPTFAEFVDLLAEGVVSIHQKIHRGQLPAPGDNEAITAFTARLRAFRNLGASE